MEFEDPPVSDGPPESLRFAAIPREHPWTYRDVLAFFAFTAASLLAAAVMTSLAAEAVERLTGFSLREGPGRIYGVLAIQILWWALSFAALYAIVSVKYGLSFGRALGWRPSSAPALNFISGGVLMAFGVAFVAGMLPMPEERLPIEELIQDRASLIVLALFGVFAAPALEEIVFRGFLFPVIERSSGTAAAIIATSALFAGLHSQQYGGHWQILSLLFVVGVMLGGVRARTGLTMPSALMHAAYNATLFIGLLASQERPETVGL